jgi:hypothetical protein
MSPESQPRYPSQPIRPNEVLSVKQDTFPEEVFIAVNGLIAERLHGQYARISVKGLMRRMEQLGLDREEAKERGWSKVGGVYKAAGWDVTYHSPSGDDLDFDPYYSFNTQGERSW